jgi:hypothetical protein
VNNLIKIIRIKIPNERIRYECKAGDFFNILDNSQGLTEEFLYAHQPISSNTIPVYSTSDKPIGRLDFGDIANNFNIIEGHAIIVARKGYAGRLFVVTDEFFIVHEDAYPIKPKEKYKDLINLWWFAEHYSMEFQSDRTSYWGIGDFPRGRFKKKDVVMPDREFQDMVAPLYKQRRELLEMINNFKDNFLQRMGDIVLNKKIKS